MTGGQTHLRHSYCIFCALAQPIVLRIGQVAHTTGDVAFLPVLCFAWGRHKGERFSTCITATCHGYGSRTRAVTNLYFQCDVRDGNTAMPIRGGQHTLDCCRRPSVSSSQEKSRLHILDEVHCGVHVCTERLFRTLLVHSGREDEGFVLCRLWCRLPGHASARVFGHVGARRFHRTQIAAKCLRTVVQTMQWLSMNQRLTDEVKSFLLHCRSKVFCWHVFGPRLRLLFRCSLGLARSCGKVQPQQFPRFLGLLCSTTHVW